MTSASKTSGGTGGTSWRNSRTRSVSSAAVVRSLSGRTAITLCTADRADRSNGVPRNRGSAMSRAVASVGVKDTGASVLPRASA